MTHHKNRPDPKANAKELLLQDYRYLADAFWKNEQTGETRVNLFIGFATVVVGALVTLGTSQRALDPETLRLVVLGSLLALLVLGVITLMRMLSRNENTDRYKLGLDTIRQLFKDKFDREAMLLRYYPAGFPLPPRPTKGTWWARLWHLWEKSFGGAKPRKFGGLVHTVAAINSILVAGTVCAAKFPAAGLGPAYRLDSILKEGALAFLAALALQLMYVTVREALAGRKLRAGVCTHAGGAVYRLENGLPLFLVVQSSASSDEWVLPKGHIKDGEGHGEAARREVLEEAGVVAHPVCVVDTVEFKTKKKTKKKENVRAKFYLMERLYATKTDEDRKPRWLGLEEATMTLTFPEAKHVLLKAEAKRIALRHAHAPMKHPLLDLEAGRLRLTLAWEG